MHSTCIVLVFLSKLILRRNNQNTGVWTCILIVSAMYRASVWSSLGVYSQMSRRADEWGVSEVGSVPMRTRSGLSRSSTAVPSAKNSGLDRICESTLADSDAELAEMEAGQRNETRDGNGTLADDLTEISPLGVCCDRSHKKLSVLYNNRKRNLTSNCTPLPVCAKIFSMASAVFTGTVDFSTICSKAQQRCTRCSLGGQDMN